MNDKASPAPSVTASGPGRLTVAGPVVMATAGDLLQASRSIFAGDAAEWTVDLGEVTRVDSAGLALLLEWLRWGRAAGRRVRFTGIPDKLLAIARLSGVEKFLVDA